MVPRRGCILTGWVEFPVGGAQGSDLLTGGLHPQVQPRLLKAEGGEGVHRSTHWTHLTLGRVVVVVVAGGRGLECLAWTEDARYTPRYVGMGVFVASCLQCIVCELYSVSYCVCVCV